MPKTNISRRGFLAGSGALAAGAAAFGLAGCAPQNSDETGDSATAEQIAYGQWSWEVPPSPIAEESVIDEIDCEILVIGAGTSGTVAAFYAAEHGANVVVLQRTEKIQGNGWSCGAWNSRVDSDFGITYNRENIMQLMAEATDGRANIRLVENTLSRTGEAAEWVIDNTPEMEVTATTDAGSSTVPSHVIYCWLDGGGFANRYNGYAKLLDIMGQKAETKGARFLFSTPAEQLIVDENGAVKGAYGRQEDGYVKVNASKGVVMATGDVSDDEEMVKAYCPIMTGIPSLHAVNCNTGDGHKMALWAGGVLDTAPFSLGMHFDPSPLDASNTPPFAAVPWLHVNKYGKRFMNENIGYQQCATAVALQPDHIAYQVVDSHFIEHAYDYENGGRTTGTAESFLACVDAGSILAANSVEGLAEAAGIDADALVATVNRYNELVEGGVDEDFGMNPKFFQWGAIKDAPFYIIPRMPAKLGTCGGLRVNEYLQAIDESHKPIEGLYAAGNCQGSFYGYDYPVHGFGGSGIGRAIAGGVLTVKSILGTFDEAI